MVKKANIREIAEMANVSPAAVSYALNGDPKSKLSEEKRKHILAICKDMHYYPNENTRRMFTKKTNTVAFFFPPITGNTYKTFVDQNFSCCLAGAQGELSVRGMDTLLVETNALFMEQKRHLRLIRGGLLDGILLWGTLQDDNYLESLLSEKIPLVMLQSNLGKTLCVTSDDYSGAKKITEEVLRMGHRKIVVVPPMMTCYFGVQFVSGVMDTLKANGAPEPYVTKAGGFEDTIAGDVIAEIQKNAPDVTCIMAGSDIVAHHCIRELHSRGFKVPEDMAVTGAGGFFLSPLLQVDSFRIPSYEIGQEGARLLCDLIEEKKDLKSAVLPVEYIPGNTLNISNLK